MGLAGRDQRRDLDPRLAQPLVAAAVGAAVRDDPRGLRIFEAALAFFQFPGTGIAFSMVLMPALILWYLNTDEVKEAFGEVPPAI